MLHKRQVILLSALRKIDFKIKLDFIQFLAISFSLAFFLLLLNSVIGFSQTQLPKVIKLGMRTTVPPIASVRTEGGDKIWSGFCHVFGQALERELEQIQTPGSEIKVEYREIINDYKGSRYPRWGSLLTENPDNRLDMQCGPNSRQAIDGDQVIFSDNSFYETGIRILMKQEVFNQSLGSQAQNSLLEALDFIKQRISIGAIADTTTFDRLESAAFNVYRYDTRELVLEALDNDEIQAFASDAIILRVLLENGVGGGEPFKDEGYTMFPEESGYLLGETESYAIAISNEGDNRNYAREVQSITNQILSQPRFFEDEKNKLSKYESGNVDKSNNWLSRKALITASGLIAVSFIATIINFFLGRRTSKNSTFSEGNGVTIGSVTINNFTLSQDVSHAALQIQVLVEQLQKETGLDLDAAKKEVAAKIADEANSNPTLKEKLLNWGRSLAETTISDVAKEVIRLAIRSTGIPLP